jgi:hypothetical protein
VDWNIKLRKILTGGYLKLGFLTWITETEHEMRENLKFSNIWGPTVSLKLSDILGHSRDKFEVLP